MPEHLRALIVILLLATAVFALAKAPALASGTAESDFKLRRNTWFAVTLAAFLAHGFWLFIAVAGALLFFAASKERNRPALLFTLLFAVPAIAVDIPGFAGVRVVFSMDWIRLLALTVLLPAFIALATKGDGERFGARWPDRLLLLYLALNFALMLASSSTTHAMRQGVFCAFIDVFLPYYVASRALRSPAAFRDAMMAFVIGALVLAVIGIFESAKGWLLYRSLEDALRAYWGFGEYLQREGTLRALGSSGQPIAFGYVMAVAIGFLIYLQRGAAGRLQGALALLVLLAALLASVSRGPWLGATVIALLALAPGRPLGVRLAAIGVTSLAVAPLLFWTQAGATLVELLPFAGSVDAQNVMYRQRLLDAFFEVIAGNPLFGAYDYLLSPEVQQLRQGNGLIDVVNTYVGVGFSSGLVGLALFAGFFAAAGASVFRATGNAIQPPGELAALRQTLLATLVGILVMIFTVSSITVIPVIYWAVAGLCVGYARMTAGAERRAAIAGRPALPPGPFPASG
jgi:O-antigen ligase